MLDNFSSHYRLKLAEFFSGSVIRPAPAKECGLSIVRTFISRLVLATANA
jgi:hypothetical protein